MIAYSTSEVARMLGITQAALSKYIKAGKVPTPKKITIGRLTIHSWTKAEVEQLRKLLPKIANGRKTRYQKKKHSAISSQQSVKSKPEATAKKRPQPRAAALPKKKK